MPASSSSPPIREDFCPKCSSLDLVKTFGQKNLNRKGVLVVDQACSVGQLKISSCSLCRLFASVAPSDIDDGGLARSITCHIRAFSANHAFAGFKPRDAHDYDATLLGVIRLSIRDVDSGCNGSEHKIRKSLEETGYLCFVDTKEDTSRLGVRQISASVYDHTFVKECLDYCHSNHSEACKPQDTNCLISFQVIDCINRVIIDAPKSCKYVVLSYVWGSLSDQVATNSPTSAVNFDNEPILIRNSIEVTLDLGLRYLWIDKYCIDQNDATDKERKIRQMHLIYGGAQVAIIAAAGNDPYHGLPGVRGTLRTRQPTLNVAGGTLVSTLPHPKVSVGRSKWPTRGWTYQEGLLSKCRLLFTDEQVVFECNGMHCAEVLLQPLRAMHTKDNKRFKQHVPSGAFRYKIPINKPWDIMFFVAEFMKRQLSDPQDRINAFQGVLYAFENGEYPLYHIMGVPILPPVVLKHGDLQAYLPRSPAQCFLIGLSWYHIKPGKRIPLFPSWSWAGWAGELADKLLFDSYNPITLNESHVWIEEAGQQLSPFPDLRKSQEITEFLARTQSDSRFIYIEGISFPCTIVYYEHDIPPQMGHVSTEAYYAQVLFDAGDGVVITHFFNLYLSQEQNAIEAGDGGKDGKTLTCLTIGDPRRHHINTNMIWYVVDESGDYAERVGCFKSYGWIQRCGGRWENSWQTDDRFIFHNWLIRQPKRRIRLG